MTRDEKIGYIRKKNELELKKLQLEQVHEMKLIKLQQEYQMKELEYKHEMRLLNGHLSIREWFFK